MNDVKRALISVYDKEGIVDFAKNLDSLGIEIISSGGTYKKLKSAGLNIIEASEYTDSPEVMSGRVKTLHPRVHGGILFRRENESDLKDLKTLGGKPIDMVVVNLYPFKDVVSKPDCDMKTALENIDIGGPSMLRSAAKNWPSVLVVTDTNDYEQVVNHLKNNDVTEDFRQSLSAKAFAVTSAYDAMIAGYLEKSEGLPNYFFKTWKKKTDLRYGENPHQRAALYESFNESATGLINAKQYQGKELSYNNMLDTNAGLNLVREFTEPTVVILKHNNPCGVGRANNLQEAFVLARECDPMSAFGGIIAINGEVDDKIAEEIIGAFYEVVLAPSYSKKALNVLSGKKNLRVLEMPEIKEPYSAGVEYRRVDGGLLVQDEDFGIEDQKQWNVVTKREPTAQERVALNFAWKITKNVKSNAILFANENATVGIGAGQMSRVDAVKVAKMKALTSLKGTVMASDAFFPFPDGLLEGYSAGATAVIQPGGSRNDKAVIEAADNNGMAMIFTGRRHFRH